MKVEFERKVAANGEIEISYLAAGSGPPLIFLHGFPDHCYGWRYQLEALAPRYRVLSPDLRGLGKSSAPAAHDQYTLQHLVSDVLAVLAAEKISQASVIGHDWGATIAWWLAIRIPQAVRHLVTLCMPHPRHYLRAYTDPANVGMVEYISSLRMPGAAAGLDREKLAGWVPDEHDRAALLETLRASDLECMLNYYRANLPAGSTADLGPLPLVRAPTLVMFAKQDQFIPSQAFGDTWQEVDGVSSVVAIPTAGHFIHHDAADFVTSQIDEWVSKPVTYFRAGTRR